MTTSPTGKPAACCRASNSARKLCSVFCMIASFKMIDGFVDSRSAQSPTLRLAELAVPVGEVTPALFDRVG